MEKDKIERFLEFLLIGVVFGTIEDLVAVKFATGAEFNPRIVLIVIAVTIPFAALSELYVDHPEIRPFRNTAERLEDYLKGKL